MNLGLFVHWREMGDGTSCRGCRASLDGHSVLTSKPACHRPGRQNPHHGPLSSVNKPPAARSTPVHTSPCAAQSLQAAL